MDEEEGDGEGALERLRRLVEASVRSEKRLRVDAEVDRSLLHHEDTEPGMDRDAPEGRVQDAAAGSFWSAAADVDMTPYLRGVRAHAEAVAARKRRAHDSPACIITLFDDALIVTDSDDEDDCGGFTYDGNGGENVGDGLPCAKEPEENPPETDGSADDGDDDAVVGALRRELVALEAAQKERVKRADWLATVEAAAVRAYREARATAEQRRQRWNDAATRLAEMREEAASCQQVLDRKAALLQALLASLQRASEGAATASPSDEIPPVAPPAENDDAAPADAGSLNSRVEMLNTAVLRSMLALSAWEATRTDGSVVPLPQDASALYAHFRAARLHPAFAQICRGGHGSATFSHRLDPFTPLCPNELFSDQCTERGCEFQHMRQYVLSRDAVLLDLLAYRTVIGCPDVASLPQTDMLRRAALIGDGSWFQKACAALVGLMNRRRASTAAAPPPFWIPAVPRAGAGVSDQHFAYRRLAEAVRLAGGSVAAGPAAAVATVATADGGLLSGLEDGGVLGPGSVVPLGDMDPVAIADGDSSIAPRLDDPDERYFVPPPFAEDELASMLERRPQAAALWLQLIGLVRASGGVQRTLDVIVRALRHVPLSTHIWALYLWVLRAHLRRPDLFRNMLLAAVDAVGATCAPLAVQCASWIRDDDGALQILRGVLVKSAPLLGQRLVATEEADGDVLFSHGSDLARLNVVGDASARFVAALLQTVFACARRACLLAGGGGRVVQLLLAAILGAGRASVHESASVAADLGDAPYGARALARTRLGAIVARALAVLVLQVALVGSAPEFATDDPEAVAHAAEHSVTDSDASGFATTARALLGRWRMDAEDGWTGGRELAGVVYAVVRAVAAARGAADSVAVLAVELDGPALRSSFFYSLRCLTPLSRTMRAAIVQPMLSKRPFCWEIWRAWIEAAGRDDAERAEAVEALSRRLGEHGTLLQKLSSALQRRVLVGTEPAPAVLLAADVPTDAEDSAALWDVYTKELARAGNLRAEVYDDALAAVRTAAERWELWRLYGHYLGAQNRGFQRRLRGDVYSQRPLTRVLLGLGYPPPSSGGASTWEMEISMRLFANDRALLGILRQVDMFERDGSYVDPSIAEVRSLNYAYLPPPRSSHSSE